MRRYKQGNGKEDDLQTEWQKRQGVGERMQRKEISTPQSLLKEMVFGDSDAPERHNSNPTAGLGS